VRLHITGNTAADLPAPSPPFCRFSRQHSSRPSPSPHTHAR
jgi:hypothetical protein